MRKELGFEEAFAKWGKPGEELDDDWIDAFTTAVREEGQLLARHEWCGAYAGNNDVWLFRGVYISEEDEGPIYGPYETFEEAADAIRFFHVTAATTNIWVHSEILSTLQLPSTMTGVPNRPPRSLNSQASISPKQNTHTPSIDHKSPLAQMAEELDARLRAADHTVIVKEPPTGEQPLVATFHNPLDKKDQQDTPKQKPVKE